jgi:TonB family protein
VRVIVGLTVDTAGNVSDAKLVSPGPSKYFARIALESARQWKFQPPTVEGSPASSAWTLRYLFGRAGTEVIPAPAK